MAKNTSNLLKMLVFMSLEQRMGTARALERNPMVPTIPRRRNSVHQLNVLNVAVSASVRGSHGADSLLMARKQNVGRVHKSSSYVTQMKSIKVASPVWTCPDKDFLTF